MNLHHHMAETINWSLKMVLLCEFFDPSENEDRMKYMLDVCARYKPSAPLWLCAFKGAYKLARPLEFPFSVALLSFIQQCFHAYIFSFFCKSWISSICFCWGFWLFFVCVLPFIVFFVYWGEMCPRRSNMLMAIHWSGAWLTFKRTFPWRQQGAIVIGDKKIA